MTRHGEELARTRTDLQRPAQAVGVYHKRPAQVVTARPIYASRNARPSFIVRHRIGLVVTGSVLVFASGITWAVIAVGPLVFLFGVFLAALAIAFLTRISRGGGGRSVSVTTTTVTKVRVR